MLTMAARLSLARDHQGLTYWRGKVVPTILGGQAAQMRTFLSQPAPPSTIRKTLSPRAPVLQPRGAGAQPFLDAPGPRAATGP